MPPTNTYWENSKIITLQLRRHTFSFCNALPPTISHTASQLALSIYKKTKLCNHIFFLRQCHRLNIIPKGFSTRFQPAIANLSPSDHNMFLKLARKQSLQRIRATLTLEIKQCQQVSHIITHLTNTLQQMTLDNQSLFKAIRLYIHLLNRQYYSFLSDNKTNKLNHLKLAQTPSAPTAPNPPDGNDDNLSLKPVVCIPPSIPVSPAEHRALSKGLKFVPLTPSPDTTQTKDDIHQFTRKLRLQYFFHNKKSQHQDSDSETDSETDTTATPFLSFSSQFKDRSVFTPRPGQSNTLDLCIDNINFHVNNFHLTKEEEQALHSLKSRHDVVIKPADKGGALVLWDKQLYLDECFRQLNNGRFYKQVPNDDTLSNNNKIQRIINKYIANKDLPPEAHKLTIHNSELGAPTFYLLPKIHKMLSPSDIPPGRPIVSACSCPTERISAFLDMIFQPYVKSLPSYVKDTNHALSLFNEHTFSDPEPRLLFTMDVSSLYTSIPHDDGLKSIKYFLDQNPPSDITIDTVLKLTSLVLNMNSFEFNGKFYQQVSGVAMGTKMGPSYACLFMGFLEQQIFDSFPGPKPDFYRRYIDDIVGITSITATELNDFFDFANGFNPNIKFTTITSTTDINFLDISLFLTPFCISTSVHYKDTDSHCYLRYTSSHPKSCRDAIPYSQFLRLRRLCSDEVKFRQEADKLFEFFRARGYPSCLLSKALNKTISIPREASLLPKPKVPNSNRRPKLIINYHPHTKELIRNILSDFKILQQDHTTRDAFPQLPLIVFRRDRNIKDHLVRSRLPQIPQPNKISTFPCPRDCFTCHYVDHAPTYDFPLGQWTIRGSYTCESRNLIYGICCKICHIFYIGQTGRRLADRFTEHLRDIKNNSSCPVARHFNSHSFEWSDVKVFVIRLAANTQARILTERKMIIEYGTLRPHGINVSLYK